MVCNIRDVLGEGDNILEEPLREGNYHLDDIEDGDGSFDGDHGNLDFEGIVVVVAGTVAVVGIADVDIGAECCNVEGNEEHVGYFLHS